jgi:hypothetical protein
VERIALGHVFHGNQNGQTAVESRPCPRR